jgi:hypothetical protein
MTSQEVDDFFESQVCPLCAYRGVFSWKAATEASIPLGDMRRGWCDTCHEWLKSKAGWWSWVSLHSRKRLMANWAEPKKRKGMDSPAP